MWRNHLKIAAKTPEINEEGIFGRFTGGIPEQFGGRMPDRIIRRTPGREIIWKMF